MQKPPSALPAFLWHFLRPHKLGVWGLIGTGRLLGIRNIFQTLFGQIAH